MSSDSNNQDPIHNEIEQMQNQLIQQQNLNLHEQNISITFLAGLSAALLGAILWGITTYFANDQIGYLAIGIGLLVGFTIRKVGKSSDIQFGLAGVFLTLFGILIGNLLTCLIILYLANYVIVEPNDVMISFDFAFVTTTMYKVFFHLDILCYLVAVYFGYKYSMVPKQIVEEKDTSTPQS